MTKCETVMAALEKIAPKKLAEDWDNPGLLVGEPQSEINRVAVCLDVTDAAIDFAISENADMLVSHHPLIFRPLKKFRTDTPLAAKLKKLLTHDIAVFAAHTNLDSATGGVNDVLAKRIGLAEWSEWPAKEGEARYGRIGTLEDAVSVENFAERIKTSLGANHVRLVRAGTHRVKKVALCGGSGAEFIAKAAFLGADAYVTGDVRYHDAQLAAEYGLHVIDAGHFATEFPVVDVLAARLKEELADKADIIAFKNATDLFEIV